MIASVRGVVVLAVVALGLALALAIANPHAVDLERRIGLGFTHVTELEWTRPRGPNLHLTRIGTTPNDDEWRVVDGAGDVDQHAVEGVVSTLASARWHRRADRAQAGTIHTTLRANGTKIEIGDPLHGADQVWIVVDDHALLVDGWVARALDPDPLELRDRTPLANLAPAETITISGLGHDARLYGHPRRLGSGPMPRAELVEHFTRACDHLELVRIPDAPVGPLDPATSLTIAADSNVSVSIGGPCPGDAHLVVVRSRGGDACADPAAVRDLLDAVAPFDHPTQATIEPRPAPIATPTQIRLRNMTISLAKRPVITIDKAEHAADPDRVAELVRALQEPAEVMPLDTFRGEASNVGVSAHGESVELYDDGRVLTRMAEPYALKPTAAVRAILDRPPSALLDSTRWLEDPSVLTRIVIDGVTYKQGAVVGEWTREPAGTFDPALVSALASTLAQLRAPARDGAFRAAHTVTITFAPPVGAGSIHTLELGPPEPTGCAARVDGAGITAPAALCTAVAAVAATR